MSDHDYDFMEESKPKAKKQNRETVPVKKQVQPRSLRGETKDIHETQFVEALLKGNNNTQSYLTVYPDTHPENARNKGNVFRRRPGVIAKLRELNKQVTDKAIEVGLYDLKQAHKEIDLRIQRADEAEQHSAVASLMREKLKLFKLVDAKETGGNAQAGFSFIINNEDGTKKVLSNSKQTIEGEKK